MQHQPLQLGHLLDTGDTLVFVEVREIAEHPAQRVAQLAVGLDRLLEDLGTDALVVPVVAGRYPQSQDIGARLFDNRITSYNVCYTKLLRLIERPS